MVVTVTTVVFLNVKTQENLGKAFLYLSPSKNMGLVNDPSGIIGLTKLLNTTTTKLQSSSEIAFENSLIRALDQ